jgi:hypothetical protein
MSMTKITHIEVPSGGAASITFMNVGDIPSDYTDLYFLVSIDTSAADDNLYFKFNNTTANTSWRNLLGFGTSKASQNGTGNLSGGGVRSATANTFTNVAIYIPNYRSSSAKSASVDSVSEENSSTGYNFIVANLWDDSSAITRVDFYLQTGSFVEHSSATLYGITAGSDGTTIVS